MGDIKPAKKVFLKIISKGEEPDDSQRSRWRQQIEKKVKLIGVKHTTVRVG